MSIEARGVESVRDISNATGTSKLGSLMSLVAYGILVLIPHSCLRAEDLLGRMHFSEYLFEATFAIRGDTCCLGTGFVVGSSNTDGMVYITARHVLDSIPGDTALILYRSRLPDSTWQLHRLRQPIRTNGKPLYKTHYDPGVDVAALWISGPDIASFRENFAPIDRSLLARNEDMRKYWLHPGDELFYLGFPLGVPSPEGLFPLLRSGFIASYPFLPFRSHPFIYLDGSIFEGNSGGPVYFEYNASSWNSREINQKGKIVGIISFSLNPKAKLQIDPVERSRDIRVGGFVNSGYILELLDSLGCR